MPEGDSLHRIARRLQLLVGERVEAESPHPRGAVTGVARAVDGRVFEHAGAVGKHLVLRFEGGVVVRNHLRMTGRWRIDPRGRTSPWPALARPSQHGLGSDAMERSRPGVRRRVGRPGRAGPARVRDGAERGRHAHPTCRSVATAGGGSRRPAGRRGCREHVARRDALAGAAVSVVRGRRRRRRRAQRSAHVGESRDARRGARWPSAPQRLSQGGETMSTVWRPIRSRGLGDANRIAYWCPACQRTAGSAEREGFEPSTSGLPPVTP